MEEASSSVVIEGVPLSCGLVEFRNVLQSSYDISPVSLSLYGKNDETKSFLAILETVQDAERLSGYGELYCNFGDFECEMKVSHFDRKPLQKDDDWNWMEPSFTKHEASNAFGDDNEDVMDNYTTGYSENWMEKEEMFPSSSVEYEGTNSFQENQTYDEFPRDDITADYSSVEYERANSFQESHTYDESLHDDDNGDSDARTWLENEEEFPSSFDNYEEPSTFQPKIHTENLQHKFSDGAGFGHSIKTGRPHPSFPHPNHPPFPRHHPPPRHPHHAHHPHPRHLPPRHLPPRHPHHQHPSFFHDKRPRHPHLSQQRQWRPQLAPTVQRNRVSGEIEDPFNRPRNQHQGHDFQLMKEQNPRNTNLFVGQDSTGIHHHPPTYEHSARDPTIQKSMYDSSPQDPNKVNLEEQVAANSKESSTKTSLDQFLATLPPSFAQIFQNKAIILVNVPPNVNGEKLQLYFQNTKRSGGGKIHRIQTISDGVLIVFTDVEASSRVSQRTHELYGRKLEIYPKNLPIRYKDRFIIKGVDQSVDEMTIEMYLENCDKINQTTPLSIHQLNLSTYMIIYDPTATSIDNIEAIRANISQNCLNGRKVETTPVYQTDCIKVENLSSETSEDFVQMFFSNTKRSGGRNATFVHKTSSQTFVFFANCNVVDDVIKRSMTSGLVLNNKQVKVSYCYDYEEQLKSPFRSNKNFPPQISPLTPVDFVPTSDKNISKEIQLDEKIRLLESNDWLENLEREFSKNVSISLDQKKKTLTIEGGNRSSVEMCWRIADDYLKGFVSSLLTHEVDKLRRKFIAFCLEDAKRNQNFQEKYREAFNRGKIPVLLYKDKEIKVMHSKRITAKEVSQLISELIYSKTMVFEVTLLKQAIISEQWKKIVIDITNEGVLVFPLQGRNVHILSLSETTPVEERINEYINKQTMREEIIDSDLEKVLFVEKYYKPVASGQVRQHNASLQIKSTSGDFISMRTSMLNFIRSLNVRYMKITEAPMKRIMRSTGGVALLRKMQNSTRQLVILQRLNGKKSQVEALTDEISTMNEHELRYRGILDGSKHISLQVMKGDIASVHCDAIVNATNERLQLTNAGVSGSILRKGDSSIQDEMNKLLMGKGCNLRTGEAVVSVSGPLPCKHIIHVVGPRWNQNSMPYSDSARYLKSCIEVCLVKAEEKQLSSITIPMISCGVFGGDPKTCSSLITDAISKHFQQGKFTSLNEVILIENSNEALLALLVQSARNISSETNESNQSSVFRIKEKMVAKPSIPSAFKMGNIRIRIIQGEITAQKCNVTLVGSNNFQGPMVNSIISKGGPMIKKELDMQTRRPIMTAPQTITQHGRTNPSPLLQLSGQLFNTSLGAKSKPLSNIIGIVQTGSSIINAMQVNNRPNRGPVPSRNVITQSAEESELPRLLVTNGHSLPCGRLIFLNLNNCYNYGLLVKQALMKANNLKAKNVSVPLIGAPGLSSKQSAQVFIESIKSFSSQITETTIEEIRVVFVNQSFVFHYREEFSKHGFKDADQPPASSFPNTETKPNIKSEEITQLPQLPNFELIFCSKDVSTIDWAIQQVNLECKSKETIKKRFSSDLLTKAPNETRDLLNEIKQGHKVEIKYETDRQVVISGIGDEVEKVHSILVSSFHQFDKELITSQFVAWKYFDSSGVETKFPLYSNHLLETAYQGNKNGRSMLDISFKNGKEATRFLVDFSNMTLQDEAFIKPITREIFHHSANVK